MTLVRKRYHIYKPQCALVSSFINFISFFLHTTRRLSRSIGFFSFSFSVSCTIVPCVGGGAYVSLIITKQLYQQQQKRDARLLLCAQHNCCCYCTLTLTDTLQRYSFSLFLGVLAALNPNPNPNPNAKP